MSSVDWDKLNREFTVPMDFEMVLKQNIANNPTRYGYDHYSYSGIGGVPRMSEILELACDSSGLIDWAARVGSAKQQKYKNDALDVGSAVHEAIELYIKTGKIDIRSIAEEYIGGDPKLLMQAECSFFNFIYWENTLKSKGYKIINIANETEIVCPLYGGTIDWIAEIIDPQGNIKKYIIDFKTSKGISTNYLLQTSGYRLCWNWLDYFYNGGTQYINGIGIIRLDKFTSEVLDFIFIDDNLMLDRLEYDVRSMVNWYYCYKDTISILKTTIARSEFENE